MSKSLGRYVPRLRERDGDDCWLCLEAIDFGLPPLDPLAKSVDHVRPVVHGGRSAIGNLRLAHRRCNERRGSPAMDDYPSFPETLPAPKPAGSRWNRKVAARRAGQEQSTEMTRYEEWASALDAWVGKTRPESTCM
jgi:5-methylcytosine-specific restriction endonuclease McrA